MKKFLKLALAIVAFFTLSSATSGNSSEHLIDQNKSQLLENVNPEYPFELEGESTHDQFSAT